MRIAAWVENYPPDYCAGAEMSLHETLLGLQSRGHEVCVYRRSTRPYEFEGVPIRQGTVRESRLIAERTDVLFVQTKGTKQACLTFRGQLPIVHFGHAYEQFALESVQPDEAHLVVMNSKSMTEIIGWQGRQIIIPPIVNPSRYQVTPGDRLTLINLNQNKGGELFWKIAAAMPGHSFLAVKGAYRNQIVPRVIPPNVKLLDHTPNVKDIYGETRVLLMPSLSETWGRTGLEAAASGIPTIAHRSPGLEEALGTAGRFADRNSVDTWIRAIEELDSSDEYAIASAQSVARSKELADSDDIVRLEAELVSVVCDFKK